VLVVIVVGTLGLVGSNQTGAGLQQQHNHAVMQATTVAIATLVVDMHATDVAYGATQDVPINAAATRSVATPDRLSGDPGHQCPADRDSDPATVSGQPRGDAARREHRQPRPVAVQSGRSGLSHLWIVIVIPLG
jgi:hypothetical protein